MIYLLIIILLIILFQIKIENFYTLFKPFETCEN